MAVTVLVLVAAIVFLGARFHGLFRAVDAMGSCEETNQSQTLSPDRRYVATVLVRECGLQKGYVTHVNLRKVTDILLPDRSGVITAGEVVTTNEVASVTTRWVGNAKLEVGLRGTGPLSIQSVGSWNDIVIHAVDAGSGQTLR
jgi:hypothetical protein